MRMVFAAVAAVVLAAMPLQAGENLVGPVEAGITTGIYTGPGTGRDPGATLAASAGPDWFRLNASGSWVRLHKVGTPGGYSVGGAGGAEISVGNVLVGGGITRVFADQQVWTKRVHYGYGSAGYRWAGTRHEQGVPKDLNEVRVTYFRETFSTYANRTAEYQLKYTYDGRLGTGPWCIRASVAVGHMSFDDNPYPGAERRTGLTGRFGVGLAFRPY